VPLAIGVMQIVVIGLFSTSSSYLTFTNGGDAIFNVILGAPNSWSSIDGHDGFFWVAFLVNLNHI